MHTTTRNWFAAALLMLVAAALLHTALLFGFSQVWAAMIHLTLFGWITAMIVAVNYHTMPVFTGREFPHYWLLHTQLAAFVAGISLTAVGLLSGSGVLVMAGLGGELVASMLFVLNVMLLLTRGVKRGLPPPAPVIAGQKAVDRVGTRATAAAGLLLPLALLLQLATRAKWIGGEWWLTAEHLAALGWIMLMIVGVAYHVLPRFSGHGTRGAAWARSQFGLHLAALLLIGIGLGFGWGILFAIGGVVMSAALALFAWTIWPTLQTLTRQPNLIVPGVKERTS